MALRERPLPDRRWPLTGAGLRRTRGMWPGRSSLTEWATEWERGQLKAKQRQTVWLLLGWKHSAWLRSTPTGYRTRPRTEPRRTQIAALNRLPASSPVPCSHVAARRSSARRAIRAGRAVRVDVRPELRSRCEFVERSPGPCRPGPRAPSPRSACRDKWGRRRRSPSLSPHRLP